MHQTPYAQVTAGLVACKEAKQRGDTNPGRLPWCAGRSPGPRDRCRSKAWVVLGHGKEEALAAVLVGAAKLHPFSTHRAAHRCTD